jgi:hypothetical protein
MDTKTIVMCVVALLLGMLIANMLKDVCGCKNIEGSGTCDSLGTLDRARQWDPVNNKSGSLCSSFKSNQIRGAHIDRRPSYNNKYLKDQCVACVNSSQTGNLSFPGASDEQICRTKDIQTFCNWADPPPYKCLDFSSSSKGIYKKTCDSGYYQKSADYDRLESLGNDPTKFEDICCKEKKRCSNHTFSKDGFEPDPGPCPYSCDEKISKTDHPAKWDWREKHCPLSKCTPGKEYTATGYMGPNQACIPCKGADGSEPGADNCRCDPDHWSEAGVKVSTGGDTTMEGTAHGRVYIRGVDGCMPCDLRESDTPQTNENCRIETTNRSTPTPTPTPTPASLTTGTTTPSPSPPPNINCAARKYGFGWGVNHLAAKFLCEHNADSDKNPKVQCKFVDGGLFAEDDCQPLNRPAYYVAGE